MSFNKYDKVVVNDHRLPFDAQIGTVVNTYNVTPDNVAIVNLEATGETVKVPFSNLRKYEPKTEIPEGARRITKDEFTEAVLNTTMHPTDKDDIILAMGAPIVGLTIVKVLFEDTDVVYLTEDQLVKTLWDGCDPKRIAETGEKNLSVRHCALLSMAAIVKLFDLVNIFFPSGSEECK